MTFDRDELAALLMQALEGREAPAGDEPNTITTNEFQAASGLTHKRALEALDAASALGIVEAGKVRRVSRFGDAARRPGWRFLEQPE